MARKGDGIYRRGKVWYLDAWINGKRCMANLGKNINRDVAKELASIERAKFLRGEAGIKDFVVTSWAAFVLPAATPRPIVDKLSGAMKQIAADVAMQKRFLVAGALILSSTPEEAIAFAAKERAMWKDVVALSGLKPQ